MQNLYIGASERVKMADTLRAYSLQPYVGLLVDLESTQVLV